MQRFQNILVGVDLSHADRLAASELNPPTREAIRRATWLAEHLSSRVTLFAALDLSAHTRTLLQEEYDQAIRNVEEAANDVLTELAEEARQRGIAVTTRLAFGVPWEEMTREVLRAGHDLVIVGTRDLGPAKRLLFGSTGLKLMRNCPCPVWVTKPDPDWDDLKIMVPSDFSDVSTDALHLAIDGAQLAEAKVHLLHAIDQSIDRHLIQAGVSDAQIAEYRRAEEEEFEHRLHDQLSQTDYRTLTHGVQVHVKRGPADIVIADAVEDYGADLLILGTHARTGIAGFFIGNTCERLLAQVNCSVMAVKPRGFECPVTLD